jgi:hypothetical protein
LILAVENHFDVFAHNLILLSAKHCNSLTEWMECQENSNS